ncbi:hypothetical protein NFI96_020432 [Prochilodus magdalenae]|nr:hypothetical protein NFI96_020432 [Prochilodus magdalenae]
MIIIFITFTASLICLTGCSPGGTKVHQTPAHLIKNNMDSADLRCVHSIENYRIILWYRQSEHSQLHLLGYLNLDSKYPEDALKTKIVLDGDGRNDGTLTIKNLQANDSAVYFCAASRHSAAGGCAL